MKVVRSLNGLSTTLELAVRNQTTGRAATESHRSGRPMKSAYGSAARSASDLGTSSPMTIERYETSSTAMAKPTPHA